MSNHYDTDNFIRFLLDGLREISEEEAKIRQSKLLLDWLVSPCVVAEIAPVYVGIALDQKDRIISDVESFVKHFLYAKRLSACCITNSYENVQALIAVSDDTDLDALFAELHDKLCLQVGLELFIGIGGIADRLTKISSSAADAHLMLAYKYQYAERGVINIANIVQFQCNSNFGSSIAFERVVGCFQDGDLGRMEKRLNELVEEVRRRPNVSKTSIRRTLIELTVRLLNVASYSKVDVDVILGDVDPYHWILKQNHTEIITEWIMKIASELLSQMNSKLTTELKETIVEAQEYIDENLQFSDLGLQSISAKVGLTSTYFSQFFKSETGTGVNEYITECRMERARKLLKETKLGNEDIALQIGYASASYFSRVFRKSEGLTPGQYRKNHKKVHES